MRNAQVKRELRRRLGFPSLTLFGIGMILGAGIYSVIGKAAGIAGFNLWIALTVAAGCALLTALSYAELSTMNPRTGGEFVFLSDAFPGRRGLSTIIGFMMCFAGTATATAVALAFGSYLEHFIPVSRFVSAGAVILFFSAVNVVGIGESSRINTLFTIVEVIGLLILIYWGIQAPGFGQVWFSPPLYSVFPAASLMFFAFLGFENLVNLVEETKSPEKNVPRAILASLVVASLLYILVGLAIVALLNPVRLSTSDSPMMDALLGTSPRSAEVLGIIALFSTGNTVLISILSASRIVYSMARESRMPAALSHVLVKRKTPYLAIAVVAITSMVLLSVHRLEVAASLSSFFTMLSFSLINFTLIVMRFKQPGRARPFRVPLSLGRFPLLTGLALLTTLFFLTQFEAEVYWIAVMCMGAVYAIEVARHLFNRL